LVDQLRFGRDQFRVGRDQFRVGRDQLGFGRDQLGIGRPTKNWSTNSRQNWSRPTHVRIGRDQLTSELVATNSDLVDQLGFGRPTRGTAGIIQLCKDDLHNVVITYVPIYHAFY